MTSESAQLILSILKIAKSLQLFHKLLIPDIFSRILGCLTSKDRLIMRLCSRTTEEAVARSDMYIDGNPRIVYISSVRVFLPFDAKSFSAGKYLFSTE